MPRYNAAAITNSCNLPSEVSLVLTPKAARHYRYSLTDHSVSETTFHPEQDQ